MTEYCFWTEKKLEEEKAHKEQMKELTDEIKALSSKQKATSETHCSIEGENQRLTQVNLTISNATDMLPKKWTPIDQNLVSESTHSQLYVAIFTALRNLLVTQKSLM